MAPVRLDDDRVEPRQVPLGAPLAREHVHRRFHRWQDEAARSAFGARVAAVPASQPQSFAVTAAQLLQGRVMLDVTPGLVWADGLLAYLVEDPAAPGAPVRRVALPLEAPFQPPLPDLGAAGTRDAVVLELWREALNGFQQPAELVMNVIENATGADDDGGRTTRPGGGTNG